MMSLKISFLCLLLILVNVVVLFAQINPVANDDFFTIHRNGILNVLANDQPSTGLSGSIVTLPPSSEGTITGAPDGYSFTAALGFTGTTSFTYKACNSTGCSAPATVTVNVVNESPVANPDFFIIRPEFPQSRYFNNLANDYDPDNDVPLGREIITFPSHGYLQGGPGALLVYQDNGSSYSGFDYFTYKASDTLAARSSEQTVWLYILRNGDGAEDAGYFCQSLGKPINPTNGNMWIQQTDYSLPGIGENIEINRFYNSIIQTSGLFGWGWSTKYDESIWVINSNSLRLNMPDGRAVYFGRKTTNDSFIAISPEIYGNITQSIENNQTIYILTFKDGRVHKFDSTGKLLWQKDRNGNQTTLNYDSNNRLESITDAFGRTLTITLTNDLVTQISDSISTIATYEYYPSTAKLKAVTYNDGSKYKFEYTDIVIGGVTKTFLTTMKDAYDNILENHAYDSQGRATTSELHGGVEKYTLDYTNINASTNPHTIVTDPLGRVTKNFFDKSRGRNVVTKTEGICNCGGSGSEITNYEYDDKLNLKKKVDALNQQTVYTYDSNGNRLTMTDVLETETYTYNNFGQILTKTDRMGGVWTNTYDTNGNLLTAKDALNNTTTLTYTTLGQLATVKDALNNTTTLTYDTQGRLTQVKDANNKTTNYSYDARARLTSTTNALNETTTFEYDLNNRLKKVIHPDTYFMTYTYDLAGRKTAMTDERGNTTNYGYDAAYRLTSVTDALNHTTTYGYDLMSNLVSQSDTLGNTTNYEYDDFNRLKKAIYPPATTGATRLEESLTYDTVGNVKTRTDTGGRTTIYDYDTAHRLIKTTDALLQMTQFEYNARSQMTKVKDAANQEYVFTYDALGRQLSQTKAGNTMSYVYDAVGNRIRRVDYLGRTTTYVYDNLNRLERINYTGILFFDGGNNPTPIPVATYNYDDLSRLTSATNENGTVSFTYDTRGRVKTSTDVFNHLVEYNYDAASNRTQLKLDSNVHTTYNYDAVNRLTTLSDEASQNFTFGYDIANRLISKTLPNNITTTYEYDGMSRLTRLKDTAPTATLFDRQYAYNPANQISQITEPSQTRTFGYDSVDRLTSMTNGTTNESYSFDAVGNRSSSHLSASYGYQPFNRMTSTATATMNYDANGNLTSKSQGKELWRFVWDYENRLASVSTRKQTVRYRYDALGRRIHRYFAKGGTENTKFIYDGLDVIADDNNGVLTKYQNGLGIDNKLKVSINGTAKYFLADHLGSTNALTDSNGAITESASYDSFGNATGNLTIRYQFTGREKDDFTGLYFYRARWYDANLGRFISEDPLDFKGGDINFYGYVWNTPSNFVDPLGLEVRAYFFRKGGRDGGARLEIYDNDKPPTQIWKENPNNDVNEPVGDYEWQYRGEIIDEGLFSGNDDCKNSLSCDATPFKGPIPAGDFVIAEDPSPWKRNANRWYGLYRKQPDGSYSDFAPIGNGGVQRGQFRWHLGTLSLGCLTFNPKLRDTYQRLDGLLQGTSKTPFRNSTNPGGVYQERGFGTLTVY